MDATFTKFQHGKTIRKPNAEQSAETQLPMTPNHSLTSAYTENMTFQSLRKELQRQRKETTRREQGNRGTGEQGNIGTYLKKLTLFLRRISQAKMTTRKKMHPKKPEK